MDATLDAVLQRSIALNDALLEHLIPAGHDGSLRSTTTASMCGIAMEHADSLRKLLASGNYTSAIALLRLQFEAVTRAVWLLFGASESWLAKLGSSPLTLESEKTAGDSPSMSEMLTAIERKGPPAASQMLAEFKAMSWKATNSFVHGGIHPLRRFSDGYPDKLIIQILQNSNALSTMVAMVMAIMSRDGRLTRGMSEFQLRFRDCLPPLIPPTA